jgi:hypothetical protein
MAMFPLKDLLEGTKRLFMGMQGKKPDGVYTDVTMTAQSELLVALPGYVVEATFKGTASTTKTYTTDMSGFAIINDGLALITFTINGISIEVKPGEGYSAIFKKFTSVTVSATDAFRATVLS